MPKEKVSYISNANIKEAAERYETMLDEKEKFSEEMRDLTKELKASGVDMKALRDALKIKRNPPNNEHEALVMGYLKSMGFQMEAA